MFAVGIVAALIIHREQRRQAQRLLRLEKKVLRDISNPFTLDEEYFRQHYRFTQHVAVRLIEILRPSLEPQRKSGIPAHLQVLVTLRFLAEGAFQKGCASDFNHPMSQSSVSRCIDRVLDAILELEDQYIRFPSNREERQETSNGFRGNIRIPGIIGLIDCTLVTCIRPTENEEAFINYKVGPSVIVQIIADSNYLIRNIRVCPGRNNDRFVWNFSGIKRVLEELRRDEVILAREGPYYLLGDSGYTPSPILLTPILRAPAGSPEERYTNEHTSCRSKVERTFGLLSNVWMVINRARKLYYDPNKVTKIIHVCAILHNFRKLNGEIDRIPLDADNNIIRPNNNNEHRGGDYAAGIRERNTLIHRYYIV